METVMTSKNFDDLKKTCQKIIALIDENVEGTLMMSQLMHLAENIKEFNNNPIVNTSGVVEKSNVDKVMDVIKRNSHISDHGIWQQHEHDQLDVRKALIEMFTPNKHTDVLKHLADEWNYDKEFLIQVVEYCDGSFDMANEFMYILDGTGDDLEEAWKMFTFKYDIEEEECPFDETLLY